MEAGELAAAFLHVSKAVDQGSVDTRRLEEEVRIRAAVMDASALEVLWTGCAELATPSQNLLDSLCAASVSKCARFSPSVVAAVFSVLAASDSAIEVLGTGARSPHRLLLDILVARVATELPTFRDRAVATIRASVRKLQLQDPALERALRDRPYQQRDSERALPGMPTGATIRALSGEAVLELLTTNKLTPRLLALALHQVTLTNVPIGDPRLEQLIEMVDGCVDVLDVASLTRVWRSHARLATSPPSPLPSTPASNANTTTTTTNATATAMWRSRLDRLAEASLVRTDSFTPNVVALLLDSVISLSPLFLARLLALPFAVLLARSQFLPRPM